MVYSQQSWVDGSAGGTPVSATRLTHIEQGVTDAHTLIATTDAAAVKLTNPQTKAGVLTLTDGLVVPIGGTVAVPDASLTISDVASLQSLIDSLVARISALENVNVGPNLPDPTLVGHGGLAGGPSAICQFTLPSTVTAGSVPDLIIMAICYNQSTTTPTALPDTGAGWVAGPSVAASTTMLSQVFWKAAQDGDAGSTQGWVTSFGTSRKGLAWGVYRGVDLTRWNAMTDAQRFKWVSGAPLASPGTTGTLTVDGTANVNYDAVAEMWLERSSTPTTAAQLVPPTGTGWVASTNTYATGGGICEAAAAYNPTRTKTTVGGHAWSYAVAGATTLLTVALPASGAVTSKTTFGACPNKANPGNPTSVGTKYGTAADVRLYFTAVGNTAFTNMSSTYYGTNSPKIAHVSFKPLTATNGPIDIAGVTAGTYDAAITAMAGRLRAGDACELVHEGDQMVTSGGISSWSALVSAKNRFYDLVKAARPDVFVVNTWTGYLFQVGSPHYTEIDTTAGLCKGDLVGIDCDGVHPTALPYTNYDDETARAIKFVRDFANMGYSGFCVPEFGAPNINQFASSLNAGDPGRSGIGVDVDDSARAAWMSARADAWSATGLCKFVLAYDYESTAGNELTAAATIAMWTGKVTAGAS